MVTEPLNVVRWSPLDSAAVLAFSSNSIIIAIRVQGSTAPIFCKHLTFDYIIDVQFLPFAGNYLALLTKDSMVYIIDWQVVDGKITTNEDKAQFKVNSNIDQIHVCGLHINERTIKMGEYNHLLMISKGSLSLLDVSLEDTILLKEIYTMPLIADESLTVYFDIYYGLLYILEVNTGKLSVYQYKHNQNTHSFEEFYTKVVELNGNATSVSAVMEGFGRLGSNIRIIVADTQGVKLCRVNVNKVLSRVDEKILNLEVFRPKTNSIPEPVPNIPAPKFEPIVTESTAREIANVGLPPGLLHNPRPEFQSIKVDDLFAPNNELTEDPSIFQEPSILPLMEEEKVKSNIEEVKELTVPIKDESINEKLAALMSFGKEIDSEDKLEAPFPLTQEETIPEQPKVNIEELKETIADCLRSVIDKQIIEKIIPKMESTLRKVIAETKLNATEDTVKFLKQRELEYAKMESMCTLYEINVQKLIRQQQEYTNTVLRILKDNKPQVTQDEKIPVIPTVAEHISPLFIPETTSKPMMKEGMWSYITPSQSYKPMTTMTSYERYYQPPPNPFEPPPSVH